MVVNEDQLAGAQFIVYGESRFVGGAMKMQELSSTPSNPASGTEAKLYVKSDKLIVQFNDGGTVRYKYLTLAAAGASWADTTTPP